MGRRFVISHAISGESIMPVHDWMRVDASIFHDFHLAWIGQLHTLLNCGLLPQDYYALAEQHTGQPFTDVLTLPVGPVEPPPPLPLHPGTRRQTIERAALARRRSLAIRHVSGHRLVALVEIVSPANIDRPRHVEVLALKIVDALDVGVHVLLVDLLTPSTHDPNGMHSVVSQRLEQSDEEYDLPADQSLTLASYCAGPRVEVYLQHIALGALLPEMPMFLRPDRYIHVPLEPTYVAAYRGLPEFWRNVLEGRLPQDF
jgi:hypothetical protein